MRAELRIKLTCLTTVLFLLGPLAPAEAHLKYQHGTMWQNDHGKCVQLYVELSDGDASHGYLRTTVWAKNKGWTPYGTRDCITAWDQPAKRIRLETTLWKWTSRYGWGVCDSWVRRNPSETFRLNFPRHPQTCGDGWYGVTAGGQVYIGSNVWVPRWDDAVLYSGAHWLEG